MNSSIKLVGWAIVAIVLFWIVLQVVSALLAFLSWLVGIILTLAVVGLLLLGAYLVLKYFMGGSSGGTTRERERIYE